MRKVYLLHRGGLLSILAFSTLAKAKAFVRYRHPFVEPRNWTRSGKRWWDGVGQYSGHVRINRVELDAY